MEEKQELINRKMVFATMPYVFNWWVCDKSCDTETTLKQGNEMRNEAIAVIIMN